MLVWQNGMTKKCSAVTHTEWVHRGVWGRSRQRLGYWLLHVEFNIMQFLQAEPFTINRHPEVAQINSVLGPCHFLFHGISASFLYLLNFHLQLKFQSHLLSNNGITSRITAQFFCSCIVLPSNCTTSNMSSHRQMSLIFWRVDFEHERL